jgi:hypothetical protein
MTCQHCTDDEGLPLYPSYGPAPHTCFYKIPGATIGQSQPLPPEQWPAGFTEDPDCKGLGTYWCEHCGDGKPEQTQ